MYQLHQFFLDVGFVKVMRLLFERNESEVILSVGCSLSPMLFALYISELGQELTTATQGVTMHRVCVSALFFAVGD